MSTLYPHLPEIIANLVKTRIDDLTDRIDPLNDENDQELIESTSREILELSNFLRFYYGEDKSWLLYGLKKYSQTQLIT